MSGFSDNRDSGYGSGHSNNTSSSTGPHKSSLLNKLDPRVDSSNPTSTGHSGYGSGTTGTGHSGTTGTGHSGTTGTGHSGTTGTGHSGYGGNNTTGYDNPRSTNEGPHGSNLANTADPRVDSDRSQHGTHGTHGTTGSHGTHGATGGAPGFSSTGHSGYGGSNSGSGYDNTRSTNEGPHKSNLANKVDPRVDSDRDNRATGAGYGSGPTGTSTGHSGYGTTGSGHSGQSTGYDNSRSANDGPHSSNLANKVDPRVDSDRDNYGGGAGYGNQGAHGTHGSHGTTGSYGTTGGNSTSTNDPSYNNPSSTTAGPHGSNLANKLDPRVDSDHSKQTTGGLGHNTGYGGPGSSTETEQSGIHSSAEGHGPASGLSKSRHGAQPATATANASVAGAGPTGTPEGQASASGPASAKAETSTNPLMKGIEKLTGKH